MRTTWYNLSAVLALLLTLAATPAVAQSWRGVPLATQQSSLGVGAGFPEGADVYMAEVSRRLADIVTAGVDFGYTSPEVGESAFNLGGHAALHIASGLEESGVNLAPVAGLEYMSSDAFSLLQIPVGASVGAEVEVSDGIAVLPYAVPQFVWSRLSADGAEDSLTDSDFGVRGGGNVRIENLFFGAFYQKLGFGDDSADGTLGILGGVIF